jgi:hypothetical protein
MRSEVTWVVFILAGIAFVVGAAVLIGAALAALPFIWGWSSRSPWSCSWSRWSRSSYDAYGRLPR